MKNLSFRGKEFSWKKLETSSEIGRAQCPFPIEHSDETLHEPFSLSDSFACFQQEFSFFLFSPLPFSFCLSSFHFIEV